MIFIYLNTTRKTSENFAHDAPSCAQYAVFGIFPKSRYRQTCWVNSIHSKMGNLPYKVTLKWLTAYWCPLAPYRPLISSLVFAPTNESEATKQLLSEKISASLRLVRDSRPATVTPLRSTESCFTLLIKLLAPVMTTMTINHLGMTTSQWPVMIITGHQRLAGHDMHDTAATLRTTIFPLKHSSWLSERSLWLRTGEKEASQLVYSL